MTEPHAIWYLPDETGQPEGPYTEDQVLQWLRVGKVPESTRIMREGTTDWRPLEGVEPFASVIREGRAASRRRTLRIAVTVAGPAVIVIAIVMGYIVLAAPPEVRQGRELIDAGKYAEASAVLEPFVSERRDHPGATYLLALSKVSEYASAKGGPGADFTRALTRGAPLLEAKKLFQIALPQGTRWMENAKRDLAQATTLIPEDAPDAVERALAIARLRDELRVGDPKQLAQDLLIRVSTRPKNETLRTLDNEVALQVLRWDPSRAGDVLELALPGEDVALRDLSRAVEALREWGKRHRTLTALLPPALLQRADRFITAQKYGHTEVLLNASGQIDRGVLPEVARKRLAYLERRLETGDAAGVVQILDRTSGESSDMSTGAAKLYLDAAMQLREKDRSKAQQVLMKALKLVPTVAKTEESAFMCIELAPKPDDVKLGRCQAYLRDYPESRHRAEILMTIVADAAAVVGGRRGYTRSGAKKYLDAAEQAATELLQRYPEAEELDARIFALGQCLAASNRTDKALELAWALLEAAPDTRMRLQVEQAAARWRRQEGRGTLPPEFDELADRVDRELKIMTLSAPGAVRALASDPAAVHVVEVAKDCTADKFSSEERELLRQWVFQGGILWACNDVLSFFDVHFSMVRHGPGREYACDPAVDPGWCPILTGCRRIEISVPGRDPTMLCNLSHEQVIPLWAIGDQTHMSMVPYGNGWVIDKKPVDLNKYDGARFLLNLRLFCLGRDIPGAEKQTIEPPPRSTWAAKTVEQPNVITTADELSEAFANLSEQRVMWVRMMKDDISNEALEELKEWVRSGGVLWLETDLGRKFAYRVGLVSSPDRLHGEAEILESDLPVLEGVRSDAQVGYTLSSDGFVVIGTPGSFLRQRITPLLGWQRGKASRSVICAVRYEGKGMVLFRPAEIDMSNEAGRRFDANLLSFSVEVAERSLSQLPPDEGEDDE